MLGSLNSNLDRLEFKDEIRVGISKHKPDSNLDRLEFKGI